MKSMFRSSPGLRRLAATFFLTTFVSSGGHAIFIRGNGGFAVMENGVWYAHDTYEWHSLDIYFLPRYSKEAFPRGKVTDIFKYNDEAGRESHKEKSPGLLCLGGHQLL